MASAELRAIRRRIRSVESTKKITRAMELIAASRIVKARERVRASRPYAEKMNDVIQNVGRASGDARDPLLERRELRTLGVLVITSDRGLAGAYNSSVLRLAERHMLDRRDDGVALRLYAVGKKAQTYFSFRKYDVARSFLGVTDQPTYEDARRVASVLIDDYRSGSVDAVDAFFTIYRSALSYVPHRIEILPVSPPAAEGEATGGSAISYEYEPDPSVILGRLLPRYVESAIYGQLLDSSASEHASRRRAMKAATENAEDLIKVLTRTGNQARQAEITTEIAEIVGGAQALGASRN